MGALVLTMVACLMGVLAFILSASVLIREVNEAIEKQTKQGSGNQTLLYYRSRLVTARMYLAGSFLVILLALGMLVLMSGVPYGAA